MIELKICKRFQCKTCFKPEGKRIFCSDYCCHKHITCMEEMTKRLKKGLSFSEIRVDLANWNPRDITHYYNKAEQSLMKPQFVLTSIMNDENRILSEQYMIKNDRFYLPESMRIGTVINESITIKEYAESLG